MDGLLLSDATPQQMLNEIERRGRQAVLVQSLSERELQFHHTLGLSREMADRLIYLVALTSCQNDEQKFQELRASTKRIIRDGTDPDSPHYAN